MRNWEKAYRKGKLYIPYFLVGVGINFLLYYFGLNIGHSLLLGGLVGLAVPLSTMFLLSEIHYHLFIAKNIPSIPAKEQSKKEGGGRQK